MNLRALLLLAAVTGVGGAAQQPASTPSASPQSTSASAAAQEIPVIDGGLGPCSAEFQVNDGSGRPVFGVKVNVHIAYGFLGVKKMDLEAQTNVDGKVKFAGLPAKVRNPPLEFKAAKDQLTGLAVVNPASECQAKHDVVLEKLKAPANSTGAPSPSPTS